MTVPLRQIKNQITVFLFRNEEEISQNGGKRFAGKRENRRKKTGGDRSMKCICCWALAFMVVFLAEGSLADTSYQGTVTSGNLLLVQAPFGGK